MVYDLISDKSKNGKIAVLIDPDKNDNFSVLHTLEICCKCNIDFILVGGSLVSGPIDDFVTEIKKNTSVPVVLFPGSLLQISKNADAILLLSLISGRNPEYLIGNHVIAAPMLKKSKIETIPTGYMLIESGKYSTVQYISNTAPIPSEKTDVAVATAMAGEMLGLKLIYLEAGSGAIQNVPEEMISAVKRNISIPIIVGGGIKNKQQLEKTFKAGADLIVIGNSLENKPEKLYEILK
jgi:putative glycerol-1-phosphate prenyltransferase